MSKETTLALLETIRTSLKDGVLHINRLKDPHSDCKVDIKVGETTYLESDELILHYRDKNQMLAYTTIEVIEKDDNYYHLEIRDYTSGKTLQNQKPLHTILKRNSCTTNRTARSW